MKRPSTWRKSAVEKPNEVRASRSGPSTTQTTSALTLSRPAVRVAASGAVPARALCCAHTVRRVAASGAVAVSITALRNSPAS